jgi:hypothetical protein
MVAGLIKYCILHQSIYIELFKGIVVNAKVIEEQRFKSQTGYGKS